MLPGGWAGPLPSAWLSKIPGLDLHYTELGQYIITARSWIYNQIM